MGNCVDQPREKHTKFSAPVHHPSISPPSQLPQQMAVKKSKIKLIASQTIKVPKLSQQVSLEPLKKSQMTAPIQLRTNVNNSKMSIVKEENIQSIRNSQVSSRRKGFQSSKVEIESEQQIPNLIDEMERRNRLNREAEIKLYHVLIDCINQRKAIIEEINKCILKSKNLITIIEHKFQQNSPSQGKIKIQSMYIELRSYIKNQDMRILQLIKKNEEMRSWATDIENDIEKTTIQDSQRCIQIVNVWIKQIGEWKVLYEQDLRQIEQNVQQYAGTI